MKTLYRLKPKNKLLLDFFTFDTETGIQFKNGSIKWQMRARPDAFIFGVVRGYNYQKIIYSLDEFKKEFQHERYKNKIVFAHNLEYDLLTVYGNLYSVLENIIWKNKLISASNGNCIFADSTNIFGRVSLGEIAKKIGMQKPSLGNENYFSESLGMNELTRCVEDCHILWLALFEMFEFAGDIKITQASLSLTYFRRFHMRMNISHNDNTKYFWDSYAGGRTEVFKLGKTHSKVIDRNSSFPAEMVKLKFPNPKYLKTELKIGVQRFINNYLPHFEGCAQCDVYHKESNFGFLPSKQDGKLKFPIGNLSGTWNFNELRFALFHKIIELKKVHFVTYSEPMETPFKSFVDHLYTERFKTKNEFEIYRVKIFMNSLYGKFAQRIKEENIYIENIDESFDLIQDYQRKGLFLKLQMFNKDRNDAFLIVKSLLEKSLSHSIPVFSSYITSGARIELLKKMLQLEPNKVTYCDTDSVFFEIDDGTLANEYFLGGWKFEKKIVTEIGGLKNYKYFLTDGPNKDIVKHRIKGVPTKNVETIGENHFKYQSMVHEKEALRRNIEAGIWIDREKKIKGTYDKRLVLENGETKPIKI